jgi:CRP/FNR family transcriptional regulator, nitrogen oxide reductase regulator
LTVNKRLDKQSNLTLMAGRRKTPLESPTIDSHVCSLDLRLEKLGMVPFFRNLNDEELEDINTKFSAHHFSKGDTIYYQGDPSSMLRVLVFGSVKLVQHTDEGKDILIDMLKPGEYFGSLSSLGNDEYSETAQAQTDVCVLSIGLKDFRIVLRAHPSVAISVLDITDERLRTAREQIRLLSTLSVEKRIIAILSTLAAKFGEEREQGILIQLPISRKDLADMTGTSTETASRVMSQLQEAGIITTGRQWVAITNLKKLSTLSEN